MPILYVMTTKRLLSAGFHLHLYDCVKLPSTLMYLVLNIFHSVRKINLPNAKLRCHIQSYRGSCLPTSQESNDADTVSSKLDIFGKQRHLSAPASVCISHSHPTSSLQHHTQCQLGTIELIH